MGEKGSASRAPAAVRVLGIVAVFALVFSPFWDRSIIFRDSLLYYAPYKHLVAAALRHGEIYFWNPWQYLGMPFVADVQAGWFYPLNVLYTLLPFEPAHRLFILVHYPLAAIGLDLFLRRCGVSGAAAIFGGIGYALSGYLVSQNGNVPFLAAPALAPFALYFMELALGGRTRAALGSGIVIALQVFAGEPQGAAITALMVSALALARTSAVAALPGTLRIMAAALGSSIVLSLVQVLPALEMLGLATRRSGLSLQEASYFSFHPARLVEFVLPTPFGTVCPDYTFWGTFAVDPTEILKNIPWAPTVYVGLPLLALAGVGALWSVRRGRWGVLLGTTALLALALGRHTPLFAALYRALPWFRLFRYPEKYLAWVTLGLAVLAALGVEEVLRRSREQPLTLRRWAVRYLLATLGLAVLGTAVGLQLPALAGGLAADAAAEAAARTHLASGLRHFILVNLCAGIVLLIAAAGARRSRAAAALALALLAADLCVANLATICTSPANLFAGPSAAAACIAPAGPTRLGSFRVMREQQNFREPVSAAGVEGLVTRMSVWERQTLQPNLGALEGFENPAGYHENALVEGLQLLERPRFDIAALYNVGYVISHVDRQPPSRTRSELLCRDPRWDLSVLRLPEARPRAYWVPRAIAAADARAAAQLLLREDLSGAVVLTGAGFPTEDPAATGKPLTPAVPVRYEPDAVEIAIDAPAAGWLVLSDRHYPGWRAWVDGRPAPIEKANVMVRAVRVPAGPSRVLFQFEPSLWWIGATISGVGWTAVFGILLLGRRGSAPRPESDPEVPGSGPPRREA